MDLLVHTVYKLGHFSNKESLYITTAFKCGKRSQICVKFMKHKLVIGAFGVGRTVVFSMISLSVSFYLNRTLRSTNGNQLQNGDQRKGASHKVVAPADSQLQLSTVTQKPNPASTSTN